MQDKSESFCEIRRKKKNNNSTCQDCRTTGILGPGRERRLVKRWKLGDAPILTPSLLRYYVGEVLSYNSMHDDFLPFCFHHRAQTLGSDLQPDKVTAWEFHIHFTIHSSSLFPLVVVLVVLVCTFVCPRMRTSSPGRMWCPGVYAVFVYGTVWHGLCISYFVNTQKQETCWNVFWVLGFCTKQTIFFCIEWLPLASWIALRSEIHTDPYPYAYQ